MALAVPIGAGDRVTIRMPTPSERQTNHLADDEPVLEIRRTDGTVEILDGAPTEVVFMASNPELGRASHVAKLQHIVADLQRAMATGGLRPGDQLPTEEQLATRYHAGRSTVRHALAEIRKLGLARMDGATGALVVDSEHRSQPMTRQD
jgi:DNA-binding GntR family transcriptional regulator